MTKKRRGIKKGSRKGFSMTEKFLEESDYPTVDKTILKHSKTYEPDYTLSIWKEEKYGHTTWMIAFVDENGIMITDDNMPYSMEGTLNEALRRLSIMVRFDEKSGLEY